jgi:CRISPR-associated protein, Csy3 family
MAKNNDTASVLAFEKKLVPSDGYLFGCQWETKEQATPLSPQEKSVRGTISNRFNKKDAGDFTKDPAKLDAKVESPNLQRVDACALGQDHDTLKLHFTLKVLGGLAQPSACNNTLFKHSYGAAVSQYIAKYGCFELAKRYATNLANARFLWRNRVGAEDIEVQIKALNKGAEQTWTFDAKQFSTRHFDHNAQDIDSLAERIATALASESEHLMLQIDCYAKVGKAQEVYPSEELVLDKGNSTTKKHKILYAVNQHAAMHSQKIGNALRTIDTWYPDYASEEQSAGAIAIEPYGAVTNLGKAFRTPKDKQDFYTFFDKWARGESLSREEDEHYVMAVLVRGGVFGKSEK